MSDYQYRRQLEDRAQEQNQREREKTLDLERQAEERRREVCRLEADKASEIRRKGLAYREELLKSTLARAMTNYCNIKAAKRLLRARGRIEQGQPSVLHIIGQVYDEHMELVNRAQIDFENLARDVKTSELAFPSPNELIRSLKIIEKYIGRLITEYERERLKFEGNPPLRPLSALPVLADFLSPGATSEFGKVVGVEFRRAQSRLRDALQHPQLLRETAAAALPDRAARNSRGTQQDTIATVN
jgi:hypothetical protein